MNLMAKKDTMNPKAWNNAQKADKMESAQKMKAKNGGHVTRYGNYYTNEEWATIQAEYEAEANAANEALDKIEIIIKQAGRMLEDAGIDKGKGYSIAYKMYNEGASIFQFSSKEKEETIKAIEAWMTKEERKI